MPGNRFDGVSETKAKGDYFTPYAPGVLRYRFIVCADIQTDIRQKKYPITRVGRNFSHSFFKHSRPYGPREPHSKNDTPSNTLYWLVFNNRQVFRYKCRTFRVRDFQITNKDCVLLTKRYISPSPL